MISLEIVETTVISISTLFSHNCVCDIYLYECARMCVCGGCVCVCVCVLDIKGWEIVFIVFIAIGLMTYILTLSI